MVVGRGSRWCGWTAGSLGIAVGARLLAGPLPLNSYDVGYALVWGREILAGRLPDYLTPGASTPHPLGTLLATLAAAFGTDGGWDAAQAIILLSLGMAGAGLFSVTRRCVAGAPGADGNRRSWRASAAGVAAVGALMLNPAFLTDVLGGSSLSDLPALALVLAGVALASEGPHRSRATLVLLGLAGLLRPEAWGLAGAYWLYLARTRLPSRALAWSAGLALAAPISWAVCDAVVVGDPTYSLIHTQEAAGAFPHGLSQVPRVALVDLHALVGLPVLAVGSVGALVALVLAGRATAAALALLGLASGEFVVLGIAGVPLVERFLLIVAAMISLFFAYAIFAGRDQLLPLLGRERRWLRRGATAAAVAVVAYVAASHLAGDLHLRADQRAAVQAEVDLSSLAGRQEVRAALGQCRGFYVPSFTLTPLVAYDFRLAPETILPIGVRPPDHGLILAPVATDTGRYFAISETAAALLRGIALASPRPVSENRSWRLFARGCPAPRR